LIESSSEDSSSSSSDSEESSSDEIEDDHPPPKGKNKYKIPKLKKSGAWTSAQLENIKKNWPHLKNFDDCVLKNTSLKELSNLGKNKLDGHKALSRLMAANYEAVTSFPTKVEAGTDDCTGLVHNSRFLRGYVGDPQELWIQARTHLGPDGLDPIANYEMVTLGLGDLLTPKVWGEAHKPNSRSLSIRMLSRKSADEAWRDPDKSETPKEFETMRELQTAMTTLECAIHRIMPWNLSFKTLQLFLISNNFGASELAGKPVSLTHTANFVDEILRDNAKNWEEKKKFFSYQDLCARWSSFLSRNQQQTKPSEQTKRKDKPKSGPTDKKVRVPAWVCRKFNAGDCDKKEDKHPSYWDPTFILKHLCSKVTDRGKLCFENHPECQHK
jgi:hypothetical protein